MSRMFPILNYVRSFAAIPHHTAASSPCPKAVSDCHTRCFTICPKIIG